MSSTTTAAAFAMDAVDARPLATDRKPVKPGRFASIYSSIIAGQEARARAIVARHMALYDDIQLEDLGWTKAEIAQLRRGR